MPESIFISYRRTDSQHAVFAIADRLRWTFGPDEVFLDRSVIKPGDEWPESLGRGVNRAKVVLPVIGESWLTTADEWGRRRIDDENDWVRREIGAALAANAEKGTAIIPVLLETAKRLRSEAFDSKLQRLAEFEPVSLTADKWEAGLETLIVQVAEKTGLARLAGHDGRHPNGAPARPRRVQTKQQPMKDAEVREALEPLAQWRLQWGPHSWGAGGLAQEITKSFDFTSFADAIAFMSAASIAIDAWKPPHHRRWENQWKVVNVFFTTWDVDCRVTKLDIKAAEKFDALTADWRASAGGRT
jgi:pterin-4a-carbinolamine dehydratase